MPALPHNHNTDNLYCEYFPRIKECAKYSILTTDKTALGKSPSLKTFSSLKREIIVCIFHWHVKD